MTERKHFANSMHIHFCVTDIAGMILRGHSLSLTRTRRRRRRR